MSKPPNLPGEWHLFDSGWFRRVSDDWWESEAEVRLAVGLSRASKETHPDAELIEARWRRSLSVGDAIDQILGFALLNRDTPENSC